MNKPRIYISSTFFDLEGHRKILIDALLKTRIFDVVSMEYYGTQSASPLDQCLKDVDSCEFYILLLGKRYGFIPQGQQYSITNLEYKTAIGDTDTKVIASTPQYSKRCVLPFLQDPDYVPDPTVTARIVSETASETPELAKQKEDYLNEFKQCIQRDFIVDKAFTSPEDLVAKVIGALIPALSQRGYISQVNDLVIKPDVIKRVNRDRLRADFLCDNAQCTDLYRLFVVHGEQAELPMVFSDCIEQYDLDVRDSFQIILEDYFSTTPEKFVMKLIRDICKRVFNQYPGTDDKYGLKDFADKVIADTTKQTVVIKLELLYNSWLKRYDDYFKLLFKLIADINSNTKSPKNIFLLFNVRYVDNSPEEIQQVDVPALMLDKLGRVNILHIQDWISNHLFSTSDRSVSRTYAAKIAGAYFDANVNNGADCTLSTVIPVLGKIVNDFNNNKNIFADYQNLFS